ncbi:MAG: SufD family Fe-S cluster assembly protein, partial [Sphingobacterium sp.]
CTMGQFDDEALFYLRSRGIGEESARILLVHAFAFDVTSRFNNEVIRHFVEDLVAKGLERK